MKKKPKIKKYTNGGLNKFAKNAGYLGMAIGDGLIGEFAPDAIKQDQYADTKFGRDLGNAVSVKESFDSQSPLAKMRQKVAPYDPNAGMNEKQTELYGQMQPYAKAGSQIGEMWAGSALGAAGGTGGAIAKQGVSQGEVTPMTPEYKQDPYNTEQTMYARNGGVMNAPNAELEKQEIFKTPNGQVAGVNGNSHEQGGVQVNIPNGTKILSDKLKMNGKTFADLGSKYKTTKEDKIMSNDKADRTSKATAKLTSEIKQRKLDELFTAQESLKQSKLAGYAKKLGIDTSKQKFTDGGIFSRNIPSMTSNEKARLGYENDLRDANTYGDNYNYNQNRSVPIINDGEYVSSGFNPDFTLPSETDNRATNYSQYADIASGLAQSAGAINGLITNKPQPAVAYKKPSVKYMDPRTELASNSNSNAGVVNGIKDYSGGNAEQYMRSRIIQGANNSQTNAATINKYDNMNSEIYNRNQSEVSAIDNKGIDATAADQARYRDLNTNYIGQIGSNMANMYKDGKSTQQDYKTLGMISNLYPNYKFNQKTGEWNHKTSGAKLTQEEINKIYK